MTVLGSREKCMVLIIIIYIITSVSRVYTLKASAYLNVYFPTPCGMTERGWYLSSIAVWLLQHLGFPSVVGCANIQCWP